MTLIEVMITVLLISIGLLGVAQISVTTIESNTYSQQITMAATLAQDKVEELHRVAYANAVATTGTEAYGTIANYAAYKRVTTITPDAPAVNMLTATVTVFWNADARSVSVNTIFAE